MEQCLAIMPDHVARRRLKLISHASWVAMVDHEEIVRQFLPDGYAARAEGAVIIDVVAFHWNCPQHITRRWSAGEIEHQCMVKWCPKKHRA